jgi:SAM-dependent methyltransferase
VQTGITFPPNLEKLLVLRALGANAAEKAERGYLSNSELSDATDAMLELSDRFNGIDATPLGGYMDSRWHRAAYFLYFLPANFAKARAVAAELAPAFAGRDALSILDVGSGPGSLTLGFVDFLARETGVRRIEVRALDSSRKALDDLRFIVSGYAAALAEEGIGLTVTVETAVCNLAAAPAPRGEFDCILFGDSLNELFRGAPDTIARRASLVASYARNLSETGSVVVIEPALKDVSRELHAVRDLLAAKHGLSIYAPCLRQGPCPMLEPGNERDWCHTSALWMRPTIVRRIDEATGRNKFTVKFSYLVARRTAGYPVGGVKGQEVLRVVGDRMIEKGKSHALLCGESGCRTFTLLTRDECEATEPFTTLHRGDVVTASGFIPKGAGAKLTKESSVSLLRRFSLPAKEE